MYLVPVRITSVSIYIFNWYLLTPVDLFQDLCIITPRARMRARVILVGLCLSDGFLVWWRLNVDMWVGIMCAWHSKTLEWRCQTACFRAAVCTLYRLGLGLRLGNI